MRIRPLCYEADLLKTQVCTNFAFKPTEAGCQAGVDTHWADIAAAIAAEDGIGDAVCSAIDPTCTGEAKAWDCAVCTARFERFEDLIGNVALQGELVTFLYGPAYCGGFVSTTEVEECRRYVEDFMPFAWQYIFKDFSDNPEYFCENVYGVCEGSGPGPDDGGNGSLGFGPFSGSVLAGVALAVKLFA